jgi:hypothetical protein
LKFVGEYTADKNDCNFYMLNNTDGETVTGIIRSNVRVDVPVASPSLWFADAYTLVDGKEVQFQSYRFTRS